MPTLAAGSKPHRSRMQVHAAPAMARGLTLLELLVVVSIIALAAAGVVVALPDPAQSRLEQEAVRLSALLEAARAQSRTRGLVVRWQGEGAEFSFSGLPADTLPQHWLYPDTRVQRGLLVLGPDPLIAPQSVWLRSQSAPQLRWRVSSDGLHPFVAAADGLSQ
jgi:general secretion pathway protein H